MKTRRFRAVAVGGTFDHIHKGHKALLSKAFEVGEYVLIGVTSDRFAKALGKNPSKSCDKRIHNLEKFLERSFPGRRYEIGTLEQYFGAAVFRENVEALVVTEETLNRIELANKVRRERGLKPLEPIVVPFVLADDGGRISTTRIRLGEIDEEGHLLRSSS